MKITHLGTGAAERIPALFCQDELCTHAREAGGKDIRTQAQALVDDTVLLDFGGDSYLHSMRYGLNLARIPVLLVTHWHSDHFYGEDLAYRLPDYANNIEDALDVYGTRTVEEFFDRALHLEEAEETPRLRFHTVSGGDSFSVLDGRFTVHVFEATHGHRNGDCVFYGMDDGDKALLYAHDTGPFTETSWQQIADAGVRYDYVSLDCTGEFTHSGMSIHMSLPRNAEVRDRLLEMGLADDRTIFVANHFSHNCGSTHEQLVEHAAPMGFRVAFDGMSTEL
ncbi:MBL fold metallo-hydrolase [Acidipropionibacterium acidipropionici]|uniref:Metallo-beta-lactamase domain-containing protein n=1 Tax=Acidipropionibacterium acidipropionici TaxID=1748 RepID=A0AAC8YH69_9ACTN|nr:MBL fold metallo-hydrolase [Acidipropionibacterium acidipropionici]AMS06394.1 hypothetical protein AXH35_14010 [Acidipropionibacterium acidipropionici]AOZ47845.1 hypothetical protein A8L58_15470 [Acidipropionibacterium acidipropionici]